jgi:membrane associated rhomboid family serine protease
MNLSYAILIVIIAISIISMNDQRVKSRFMFNAYAISRNREWWRFFTHGVLHADYPHLIFNMLSLYFFGPNVEAALCEGFGDLNGKLIFALLFIGALPVSSIASFFKHKEHSWYNALGASGAVSAVIFAAILLDPTHTILVFLLPLPAWLYGIVFLGYSFYAAKRNADNIGHDAHFWGAIYGFILPVLFAPELIPHFMEAFRMH